jgi:hypothetical protein
MSATKVFEAAVVVTCLAAGAAVLLLQGCGLASDVNTAVWGRPAAVAIDANGRQVIVAPAVPGLLPPVTESLAAIAAALGLPILALWIRAVSRGAQATKAALDAGTNRTTP